MRHQRRLISLVALLGVLGGPACTGGADQPKTKDTLVVAYGTEPTLLDSARTADVSSTRVNSQIFETLVAHEPGGLALVPSLARSWTAADGGATWTFALQTGVRFHDGTAFDAAAVCANFDRWYRSTGVLQTAPLSPSWRRTFEGFAVKEVSDVPDASLFRSCEAKSPGEAVVHLTKPLPALPTALTGVGFSIASPDALVRYEADKVAPGPPPKFEGTFGTEHPIGTGPFRFESWTRGDRLVLVRNDDYWGDKAELRRIIFRAIADGASRRQALEAGEVDMYEPVDPADAAALEADGAQIAERQPLNVGFLGFNQAIEPFGNPNIRMAIAHALNRQAVLQAKYPVGTMLARELQPPDVWGWAADVATYPYDPDRARQLLAESGVADPTIEFWYPTNTSQPDNPDPLGAFEAYKADLEAVGFTVVGHPAPAQPDYSQAVAGGKAGMFFGARYGDNDPDYFFGPSFRQKPLSFGFDDPELFAKVSAARYEPDHDTRVRLYEDINRRLMTILPAVPLVHVRPQVVLAAGVRGYQPGPIGPSESLASVMVTVES